ncbi:MAG: PAS domain S-box protein [Planctomycetales bacterium]|nr:PAS domain S-box protein [Planctomycetales bacterium]
MREPPPASPGPPLGTDAHLRVLLSRLPVVFWTTDRELRLTSHYGSGLAVHGIQPGQFVGKTLLERFGTEDRSHPVIAAQTRALAGESVSFECELRDRSYSAQVEPLRDASGAVSGAIGVAVDVTELRRATEGLRESEAKFRALAETMPVGICIAKGPRLLYVNPESERITGYGREELLRMDAMEIVAPEAREETLQRALARQRGEDVASRYELEIVRKDGQRRWTEVAATRVQFGGESCSLATSVDITERRRAAAERARMEAQLHQARKLESLGIFAGGLAHDFNNLLAAILGNARLALDDLPEDSPARVPVANLERAARRATELTAQMLAFSGQGRFAASPVDLSAVAEESAALLETVLSRKAALRLDLAEALPRLSGDPSQLRQVVMNLLKNASDALGGKAGEILVRTARGSVARGSLGPGWLGETAIEGPIIALEVTDTGAGMDAETRERLFDPFFTTKRGGRGLGLAVVLGIVRRHHGAIAVESAPGRGTTVRVFLPAGGAEPPRPPTRRRAAAKR